MLYYSPSTKGFYDTSFAKYTLPEDCIEISKKQYENLYKETSTGVVIEVFDGEFKAVPPELTPQQLNRAEVAWVSLELIRAGEELDKVQDSDAKAIGTVSAWRAYRKALRVWADDPNFPNKEFRPSSPGA